MYRHRRRSPFLGDDSRDYSPRGDGWGVLHWRPCSGRRAIVLLNNLRKLSRELRAWLSRSTSLGTPRKPFIEKRIPILPLHSSLDLKCTATTSPPINANLPSQRMPRRPRSTQLNSPIFRLVLHIRSQFMDLCRKRIDPAPANLTSRHKPQSRAPSPARTRQFQPRLLKPAPEQNFHSLYQASRVRAAPIDERSHAAIGRALQIKEKVVQEAVQLEPADAATLQGRVGEEVDESVVRDDVLRHDFFPHVL